MLHLNLVGVPCRAPCKLHIPTIFRSRCIVTRVPPRSSGSGMPDDRALRDAPLVRRGGGFIEDLRLAVSTARKA